MNIEIIHYNLKKIQKEILSIPHFGIIYEWSFTSRKCHLLLSFLLAIAFFDLLGQRVINFEKQGEGAILLAEDISIEKVNSGYTVWLPDNAQIKGLVVFMNARRDTSKSEMIIDYSLKSDLGVMYMTTENRLEFFFENERMQEIEEYIHHVIENLNISKDNLMYCGMSLAGTRALRLAKFGQQSTSKFKIRPRAIAICDAPLDMVRFYKESVKANN